MKYIVIILTSYFVLIFSSPVFSQGTWISFYKNIVDDITAIAIEGDIIWLGTYNGLAKYNKITGKSIPYTEEDGLVNNDINDITVDNNGVKWIATNSGISRFDNVSFTSFSKQELGYTEILGAAADSNNIKWFISQNALLKFDDISWHVYTLENGLPVGSLTTIAVDKTDTVWIGTEKKGILSFDGTEWILHEEYKKNIVSIAIGVDNTKWFGNFKGSVISYNDEIWDHFQVVGSMWFLYSVAVSSDNIIWASTNFGLYRIENDEKSLFNEENGLIESYSRKLASDSNGDIWIAGYQGLTKFDGDQFTNNLGFTGPINATIYSIAVDNTNVKWFGQRTHQLLNFNDKKWSVFTMEGYTGLGNEIAVTRDNNVWFTAGRFGALKYNGYSIECIDISLITEYEPLSHEYLEYVDTDGKTVWFSTTGFLQHFSSYHGRILKYDSQSITNLSQIRNDYSYRTYISLDSRNYLWIADEVFFENKGLSYFNGTSMIQIPIFFNNKVKVNDIFADSDNTIWIPSENGLYKYYNEKLHHYTTSNSGLSNNFTLSVAEDRYNTLWIGTYAGVSRFDGETWTTFNTDNSGLCDNKVNAIAVEKNNTIWFGTDNGVSRYTGEVITTSVDENDEMPEALHVIHSYPNPFNPSTTIEFTLPESGFTTLSIYNISGQKVRELAAEYMTAGTHSLTWDGRDGSGDAVSSGVYITRLVAGKQVAAGRMILMK